MNSNVDITEGIAQSMAIERRNIGMLLVTVFSRSPTLYVVVVVVVVVIVVVVV